ncbi:MAG: hypothetical protein JKY56_03855 [Kofleriaceae bacterium]|nr:hypothetical protein [Kofleriaceae bacterium]
MFPFVRLLAFLAGALLSTGLACGNSESEPATKEKPPTSEKNTSGEQPPKKSKPKLVHFEDTSSGLKRLMRTLRVAIESDDEAKTVSLLRSLRLSDAKLWMKTTFGETLGETLATTYAIQSDEIGVLAALLKEQFKLGRTEIQVERFESSDDLKATGYQRAALNKMLTPTGLYSVRFRSMGGTETFHIWSFVHNNKSFRYVGKLRDTGKKNMVKKRDLSEYRIRDVERISAQK